jgi:hypothetical protein
MEAAACSDLASWFEFCRRGKTTSWFKRDTVALAPENSSGVNAIHDHLVWPERALGSQCGLTDEPWLAHPDKTGLNRHAVSAVPDLTSRDRHAVSAVPDLTSRGYRHSFRADQCSLCRPEAVHSEASIAAS